MANIGIRIENLNNVLKTLSNIPNALEDISKLVAEKIKPLVVARTPVGEQRNAKERAPGLAKKSWSGISYTESGYSFGNNAEHILALDRGSIPGMSPWPSATGVKTRASGNIFSSQAVGGIAEPVLKDKSTLKLVIKTIANHIEKEIAKHA